MVLLLGFGLVVPALAVNSAEAGVLSATHLRMPGSAVEGAVVATTATFVPARPGRPVRLQLHRADRWVRVATTTESSQGSATLHFKALAAGAHRYRAVSLRVGGPLVTPVRTLTSIARLPRVVITTDDGKPITSSEEYSHASFVIQPRGSGLPGLRTTARLRVRGNSTSWIAIKLPYKVKLDEEASVLSMPRSEDWVLLANFYDRSMLRNDVAFEVARRVGVDWAPRMRPVEVWQNGTFQGLYQFGEGIEIAQQRVDLDTDAGDYLLEADTWPDDGTPVFVTGHGLKIWVKEPDAEDVDEAMLATIRGRVQAFEDALYSPDFADPLVGYRAYVDVRSFIDWYLVNEVMKTLEAPFWNSCWMYSRDGLLHLGPVWDFDQSAGNRTNWQTDHPTGWYLRRNFATDPLPGYGVPSQIRGPEGHWLIRMWQDPWFAQQVETRWAEVRSKVLALPGYLRGEAAVISYAAGRNFAPQARGGAGMPIEATFLEGPEHVFQGSWPQERTYLVQWLTARVAWMDQQLS